MLSIFSYTFSKCPTRCAAFQRALRLHRHLCGDSPLSHCWWRHGTRLTGRCGDGAFWGFSPIFGAACFALASGLGIDWLSRKREVRGDSAIAMIWTLGMSIGILFAYLAPVL